MSLPSEIMSQVENTHEEMQESKASKSQVSMFSYQVRANRSLSRAVFPDHISSGVNRFLEDAEEWASKQTKWDLSEVIALFLDDKADLAIKKIKHLQ